MIKDAARQEPLQKDILDSLWTFLSSAKTAIWLLSVSTVAILAGTLVEQNQPMEKYISTYGPTLTHMMQAMDIFDLYRSWWFELLMAFICVNLILSNFNRAEKIVKKYYHIPVRMEPAYFENASGKAACVSSSPLNEAALKIENALLKLKYRVKKETSADGAYFLADRGQFALWGSFVAHIGLLLLFVAVIYGHFPGQGFERNAILMEGDTYRIPESHFSFTLNKFEAQWDENRRPLLYRSTVTVHDDGGKTFTQAIEVNHPLVYRGVKVYQATYGPGRLLGHYVDSSGASHPFSVDYSDDRMMFFTIEPGGGKRWVGVLKNFIPDFTVGPNGQVGSLSKEPVHPGSFLMLLTRTDQMPPDPKNIKSVGWITPGHAGSFKGVKFYLDKVSLYSGFQLRKDPGVKLVYISFLVILFGVALTFYFHHKVIRIKLSRELQVTAVGVRRDKEQEYDNEFRAVKEAVGDQSIFERVIRWII